MRYLRSKQWVCGIFKTSGIFRFRIFLRNRFIRKVKALTFFDTPVTIDQFTWRNIPEDLSTLINLLENQDGSYMMLQTLSRQSLARISVSALHSRHLIISTCISTFILKVGQNVERK
jgi:hypothetical protein